MVRIRCHFDGKTLVPDEPVDLPVGQALIVHIEEQKTVTEPDGQSSLEWMAENEIDDPSLPHNLSGNLDHSLYGAPKREP